MNFLPTDYKSPNATSAYMKLEDGENRFRILSAPILGWEDWKDKKPVRFRMAHKPDHSIDPEKPIRHFWAFVVWNYRSEKIEIYQIVQASIRKRIEALSKDLDWGAPYKYDIKISKTGQKVDTEYEVNPCVPKELLSEIKEEFYNTPIDLEELFRGGDPFTTTPDYRTKGFWEVEQAAPVIESSCISRAFAKDIEDKIEQFIAPMAPRWKEDALKAFKINSFEQLESKFYASFMKKLEEKRMSLLSEECPF